MRAPTDLKPSPNTPDPAPRPAPDIPAALSPGGATPGDAGFSLDLATTLAGWDFEPGQVNVRKIRGDDGRPKLQLRLDLGLLQMEMTGRPDGKRPEGFDSLLDYHEDRLNAHRSRHGTELGFVLSPTDCRQIRDEAGMYYHRYLSAFVLGEYDLVIRDTQRNLRAIDFCRRHAAEERDQLAMEPFRPYVLMMHTRAVAADCMARNDDRGALKVVHSALRRIGRHYRRFGGQRAYEQSGEVRVLKKLARLLRQRVPESPTRRLTRELRRAVAREQYERAAKIRDKLAALSAGQ